jgi:hypothetical protein
MGLLLQAALTSDLKRHPQLDACRNRLQDRAVAQAFLRRFLTAEDWFRAARGIPRDISGGVVELGRCLFEYFYLRSAAAPFSLTFT